MRWTIVLVFALFSGTALQAADPVRAEVKKADKQTTIEFMVGDQLITRYTFGPEVAKPYFWPMHSPKGVPVTRAWPMVKGMTGETTDHVHQKSAWFCHGDVIPEGLELKAKIKGVEGVDFWSEHANHGWIRCTKVGDIQTGPHRVSIPTENDWTTSDGITIMKEKRTITVQDLGYARLIVIDVDLTPTDYPIIFGDTKEGSMGVRVSDKIAVKPGGGKYGNAEGKMGEPEVWGRQSLWCDYFGTIDGKEAGIAVFDSPANPHRATWHARGYGLMAANPFGRGKSGFPDQKGKTDLVKLAKGEHLQLRYGILVHDGDTKTGRVAEAFETFRSIK